MHHVDVLLSRAEFPTMRKKKKIKLTHATQPARLAAPSNLTGAFPMYTRTETALITLQPPNSVANQHWSLV